MKSNRVAGHHFIDTPRGEACSECGKLWLDMLDERERWRIGELGIAHNDAGTVGLTTAEVQELHAKLDHIWKATVF